jgi:hypothetical protein
MPGNPRSTVWRSPRVWLIIAALIALPFLAEFNARLTQSRELDAQQVALTNQIATENARHQALLNLQTWVNSDNYVEHWARLARLAKPGDTIVVPIASQLSTSISTTQPSAANTIPDDIPTEWWTAFFGDVH